METTKNIVDHASVEKGVAEVQDPKQSTTNARVLLAPESYHLNVPLIEQNDCVTEGSDTEIQTLPIISHEIIQANLFFNGPQWYATDQVGNEVLRFGMSKDDISTANATVHREIKGTTFLLGTSAGAHCYYHWMLDILPKVGLLEKAGFKIADIDYFLVRETNDSFHKETLERLGISQEKIIVTKKDSYLRCERLIHIDVRNGGGMKMHRFLPQWIKHIYPPVHPIGERIKLYISRPKGVRRGVSNESELIPILESHGYTITAMEGMSVLAQVELLSRADVLISPHGGALTNMVFCRPGIQVLELFGCYVYPFYRGLAEICDHDYHTILESGLDYPRLGKLEKALQVGVAERKMTRELPMNVDPGVFARTLVNIDRRLAGSFCSD